VPLSPVVPAGRSRAWPLRACSNERVDHRHTLVGDFGREILVRVAGVLREQNLADVELSVDCAGFRWLGPSASFAGFSLRENASHPIVRLLNASSAYHCGGCRPRAISSSRNCHDERTIHCQGGRRSSPGRSQRQEKCAVPAEVVRPNFRSRMKQSHRGPRFRVGGRLMRLLAERAGNAGQRQSLLARFGTIGNTRSDSPHGPRPELASSG